MGSFVIGIAGCSGSGKTTLARVLSSALPAPSTVLPLDSYYLDLSHLSLAERALTNFDHPDALDWPLLLRHVERLRAGRPVQVPTYNFATHARTGDYQTVEPAPFVIVEGILTFHDPALRTLMDLRVFVDAPDTECFARRLHRDQRDRGRTRESVENQYATTVRPMAEKFVIPTQRWAHIVVSGASAITDAVDEVLRRLQSDGKASAASPNL